MNASTITQLSHWLDVTEYDIFKGAAVWRYGQSGCVDELIVAFHLNEKVPPFVRLYVTQCIYPRLVIRGGS